MVRVVRKVCGVVSLGVHIGSIAFFRILPHSSAFFSDLHRFTFTHSHIYTIAQPIRYSRFAIYVSSFPLRVIHSYSYFSVSTPSSSAIQPIHPNPTPNQ